MTSTCGSDTGSMVTFGGEVEVTVAGGQFTSEVKTKLGRAKAGELQAHDQATE